MATQERTYTSKTVLETDTGEQVREAPRLKENVGKGTRPIDSVT